MSEETKTNEPSLYELYETDPKLEEEGALIKIGTSIFRIAASSRSNKPWLQAVQREERLKRKKIRDGSLSMEEQYESNLRIFIDGNMRPWVQHFDRQGNPQPYSRENAMRLMREVPKVYQILLSEVGEVDLYRLHNQEADQGN